MRIGGSSVRTRRAVGGCEVNVVGGVCVVRPEHSYPCVLRLVATMIWPLPSVGTDEDVLVLVSSFGDGVAELHVWCLLVGVDDCSN